MTKGYNLARWLSTLASSTFSHTGDVLQFLRLDLHYHELHLMAPLLHGHRFWPASIELFANVWTHVCNTSLFILYATIMNYFLSLNVKHDSLCPNNVTEIKSY